MAGTEKRFLPNRRLVLVDGRELMVRHEFSDWVVRDHFYGFHLPDGRWCLLAESQIASIEEVKNGHRAE